MPFIQFTNYIDLKKQQDKIKKQIDDAVEEKAHLEGLARTLKRFQGKQITQRLVTYLTKNFVVEAVAFGPYDYRLERIARRINLRVLKEGRYAYQFFLAYKDKDVYDEAFLFEHNNLNQRGEYIAKLNKGLSHIPMFVEAYNELVAKGQNLVKAARVFEMEYDFDILCRGAKDE